MHYMVKQKNSFRYLNIGIPNFIRNFGYVLNLNIYLKLVKDIDIP